MFVPAHDQPTIPHVRNLSAILNSQAPYSFCIQVERRTTLLSDGAEVMPSLEFVWVCGFPREVSSWIVCSDETSVERKVARVLGGHREVVPILSCRRAVQPCGYCPFRANFHRGAEIDAGPCSNQEARKPKWCPCVQRSDFSVMSAWNRLYAMGGDGYIGRSRVDNLHSVRLKRKYQGRILPSKSRMDSEIFSNDFANILIEASWESVSERF
mmetsp:Transcript_20602/g.38752  ORF Transcript_20602/g.38752 Transcript_20602/m.38752 type:complete len:212 (+) Transcript_20602:222-857(+)